MAAPRLQTSSQIVLDISDFESFDRVIDCLDHQYDATKDFRRIAQELGRELEEFYIKPLIHDLQYYPPEPNGKIDWTSDKQRKYVMMLLRRKAKDEGREPGDIKYRRTYKLRDSWHYEVKVSMGKKGIIRVRLYNDAESYDPIKGETTQYAKFVQGAFGVGRSATSVRRYRKYMQKFHRDTGWREAAPRVRNSYDMMEEYAVREYERRCTDLVLYACN